MKKAAILKIENMDISYFTKILHKIKFPKKIYFLERFFVPFY